MGEAVVPPTPSMARALPGRDNIRTPADLAKTAWLTATMRPDDWQRWLAKAGLAGLSPARWVTFDHTNLALGAAMDGLGVAIAPIYLSDRRRVAREPLDRAVSGIDGARRRLLCSVQNGPGEQAPGSRVPGMAQ